MKKSTTYRESFRRHRLLLSLPIIIAMVIGGYMAFSAPKAYMSSTNLWVDSPGSTGSTLDNLDPGATPPSQQEQSLLSELLATRDFDLAVGHQSLLGQYLATHGAGSLNTKIVNALTGAIVSGVPGPQVLSISYSGPTPEISQSVLKSVVAVLESQTAKLSQAHSNSAQIYDKSQIAAAQHSLTAARAEENAYLSQHPGAGPRDPNLTALSSAVTAAAGQLATARAGLSGASGGSAGGVSTLTVLDPATLPSVPTTGKKKDVEGVLGGLIAGCVISFLGVVALTRRESDPWEDELDETRPELPHGRPPAGQIPSSVGHTSANDLENLVFADSPGAQYFSPERGFDGDADSRETDWS